MADYSVDVGLNVQGSDYITTMGQAVAITEQYSQVAGGIGNTVNGVSQGIIGLTKSLTGFNAVNNIAVDTAAQYQKAMSGIEAKALSAGKSFTQLEKTTKQFARNFPGGMGQAVQVMGTMQQMGVKTEKQMENLGKTWIKLGAATGTNAAAMGQEFTQLSRIMGNGMSSIDKMGDSLTTVTAKIGGSAESVVAFSKVMAPIAATVGASQTAVLGLSSAMSSIGEDGARSAMVFQKVWLDMNRAIRDGGPELKAYSELLGTTSDNLKKMFDSNPTEMLLQFTEALSKSQGPEMTRTLEALGFDSVRDTRALTALARSGKAREAVNVAQEAYGNGSMSRAADVANGGVADQAIMLKESSQQIVANIGRPMLKIAEGQLNLINGVASRLNDVLESEPAQRANEITGIGSLAMQAIGGVGTAAGVIALLKGGRNMLSRSQFGQGAREAFAAGRTGAPMPDEADTARGRGGQMLGQAASSLLYPAGAPSSLLERFQKNAGNTARAGLDVFARGITGLNTNLYRWGDDRPPLRTESGMRFREDVRDSMQAARRGDMAGAWQTAAGGLRNYIGDLGKPGERMSVPQSLAQAGAGAVRTVGGAVGAVGAGVGRAIGTFVTPQMAIAGAAIGGGMFLAGKQQQQDQMREEMIGGNKDIYRFYNDFAAATGQASKGVVEFAAAVKQTTANVVAENTTMAQAKQLTQKEMTAASSSGYNAALKFVGDDKSAEMMALQARLVLGANPSAKELAQLSMDAYNQSGNNKQLAQQVVEMVGGYMPAGEGGRTKGIPTDQLLKAIESQSDWTGFTNETQGSLANMASSAIQQEAYEAGQLYGGSIEGEGVSVGADRATVLLRAQELYESALKNTDMDVSTSAATANTLGNLLYNGDLKKQQQVGLGTGFFDFASFGQGTFLTNANNQKFEDFLNNEGNEQLKKEYEALKASGVTINKDGTLNYSKAMVTKKTDNQIETEEYLQSTARAASGTKGLTSALSSMSKALFSTTEAARNLEKPLGSVTGKESEMFGGSASMNAFRQDQSSSTKRQAAVDDLIAEVIGTTKGNFAEAGFVLATGSAVAKEGSADQEAYRAAQEQLDVYKNLSNAGRTQAELLREQVNLGKAAQRMPAYNGPTQEVQTSAILGGMTAQAQINTTNIDLNRAFGALMTSMNQAARSSGIASGSVARDAAMKTRYAKEDYQQSKRYAEEDYDTAVFRSNRDFNRQMAISQREFGIAQTRAEEDYNKTRYRAQVQQNTALARAQEDYDKGKLRAIQDYEKAAHRATRDFNKQMDRATRDFNKSQNRAQEDHDKGQMRALEDFNKSKTRMTEDFNKSMKRMAEDSARQMYDPYKRIAAQMVMDAGQLVTNLKDQQAAIEKQVSNLAEARKMGLGEDTIKQLGLADATNAQQLSRIVQDMRNNGEYVMKLNEAVSGKSAAASTLATDQGNVQYSRSLEDYQTQMARMEEDFNTSRNRADADFKTSSDRAAADFNQQMNDANSDFAVSQQDAYADLLTGLGRNEEDYLKSISRMIADFDLQMDYMQADYLTSKTRSMDDFNRQTADAIRAHNTQLADMEKEHQKSLDRMAEGYEKSVKRIAEGAAAAQATIGAQLAAQQDAMVESFYGVGQKSPTDPKAAAQQVLDDAREAARILDMSFPEFLNSISDERAAQIRDAMEELRKTTNGGAPGGWGAAKEGGIPSSRQSAAGTYTQSYDVGSPFEAIKGSIGKGNFGEMLVIAGKETVAGFIKGFAEALSGGNWLQAILNGFVSGFKTFFGIASPSKMFMGFGGDIVQGLKDGIGAAISGAWQTLTDPIANLDILGKVETAFDSAKTWISNLGSKITTWVSNAWDSVWKKTESLDIVGKVTTAFDTAKAWLEDLGTKITTWISSAWDSITSPLSKLDIKKAVTDAFDTAKAWLGNLKDKGEGVADTVKTWVGGAWDNLTSGIPTIEKVMNRVKAAFGLGPDAAGEGIAQWIQGLKDKAKEGKDTVAGWLGDAWMKVLDGIPTLEKVKEKFTPVVHGVIDVVNALIGAWNKLKVSITIPDWAKALPGPQNGKDSLSFGTTSIDTIKYPFALGGIATRQMNALIGEAGYPEAVIPLNARGAEVLAATMARYIDRGTAQQAMVAGYSTPVVNNYSSTTYDQSTRFTGPITVESSNPDEMAQKLAARQRRQALVQPVRGRA